MADNVDIPVDAGTPQTVATEDVSGVHHQAVLIEAADSEMGSGTNGIAKRLRTRDSQAASDPLLLTSNNPQIDTMLVIGTGDTTAQTYADGESIGGDQTVNPGYLDFAGCPEIVSVTVLDGSNIGPQVDLFFVGDTATDATDGAAWDPTFATFSFASFVIVRVTPDDCIDMNGWLAATVKVGLRIPGAYGSFHVVAVNREAGGYVMANNGDFRVAIVLDHS